MRRSLALALALVLLGLLAAPVSAATTQRTWHAGLGSSSVNGRATLAAYTDSTGRISLSLKALRRAVAYRIEIRAGKCGALGTMLANAGYVTTSSAGAASTTKALSNAQMNNVWSVGRTGTIAVRVVSGTSATCGTFFIYRATRVRIPSYSIDLPVVPGPSGYPLCNVAMYQKVLWQPTEPGVTFIYAHARKGMFLNLLNASKISNGSAMVGKTVYVYGSNSVVHTYRITKVRRHVTSIQDSIGITSEKLWLQTSEGPNSSYPKLIIEADRIGTASTTYSASHPTPHPVSCG
jgi:hypothetical protein